MNLVQEDVYRRNGADSWIHCVLCEFKKGRRTSYHYHEYIEILFFTEGAGTLWVGDKATAFTPGTLAIINSQRAHALDIRVPSRYSCIKVMPDILSADEQSWEEFRYLLPFLSQRENTYLFTPEETASMEIGGLIASIMTEWDTMEYGFELALRANTLALFTKILRHLWRERREEPPLLHPGVKTAILYLADHYATATEQEAARLCHVSYHYFSSLFKKNTGKSFRDYLLEVRLCQAEKLLLSTEKSITEIAEETGFATTSHFISHFKKKAGITPAKFRKSLKL